MATIIHVIDSDEPGTTLIEQVEGSGVVSRSWAPVAIPVEVRLNPDAPPALDMRSGANGEEIHWRMPTLPEWVLMNGSEDGYTVFRDAMVAAGRV